MDNSVGYSEGQREQVHPAEMMTTGYGFSADTAARLAYAERNSYGAMLAQMFAEAEQQPDTMWQAPASEAMAELVGKSDAEAYRTVLEKTMGKLKESDAIKALRRPDAAVESEHDIEAVFRAYDRALHGAMEKTSLTDRQESRLKFAAHSELDWSLRDLITHHAILAAEHPDNEFKPKDFLLIVNPKLRKVDYMDSNEMLSVVRRSASMEHKDRLKADLAALRRSERDEARVALETAKAEGLLH